MFIAALMANGEVHNDPTRFEGATLVSAGALPAYNIDIDKKAKLALNPMYAVIGSYLLNHTGIKISVAKKTKSEGVLIYSSTENVVVSFIDYIPR